jgi:hypothetical protein
MNGEKVNKKYIDRHRENQRLRKRKTGDKEKGDS